MLKGLKSKVDVQFVEVKTKDLMERGKVKGGKVGWRLGGEMGGGMGGGLLPTKRTKTETGMRDWLSSASLLTTKQTIPYFYLFHPAFTLRRRATRKEVLVIVTLSG